MKHNLLQDIKQKMPRMTPSQRHVADCILKDPVEASFLTLERLSLAAGTSTTTIIRLALKLGYSGFTDFQKDLQELLRDRVAPSTRLDYHAHCIEHDSIIRDCAEMQLDNIRTTIDLISEETVNNCLALLLNASNIFIVGMRTSYPVAYYLYHGLNRVLGNCRLMTINNGDYIEEMLNINSASLVIAVSFPRYVKHTADLVKESKEQCAKILSITDGYASPLAAYSDLVLPCAVHSLAFHNSIVAPIFIADLLITATAINKSKETKSRLAAAEQLFRKINLHV